MIYQDLSLHCNWTGMNMTTLNNSMESMPPAVPPSAPAGTERDTLDAGLLVLVIAIAVGACLCLLLCVLPQTAFGGRYLSPQKNGGSDGEGT